MLCEKQGPWAAGGPGVLSWRCWDCNAATPSKCPQRRLTPALPSAEAADRLSPVATTLHFAIYSHEPDYLIRCLKVEF